MSNKAAASDTRLETTMDLRRLPLKDRNKLHAILNRNNCWRDLAAVITNPDNVDEYLFTADDVNTLELQWSRGSSPGEAFLDYWSTCGREQPTINDLLRFLKVANLYRAANDIERDLLKISDTGGEAIPETLEAVLNATQSNCYKPSKEGHEEDIIDEVLQDVDLDELILFPYSRLEQATNNFSDQHGENGGCKIGEGSYGCVYRAEISGIVMAVKKLKNSIDKQFLTELKILTRFKHENLLPLLGCSVNGPTCCLVYQYMNNGSLQEKLACVGGTVPIPGSMRFSIAYQSALGINHLHTFGEEPMVHRDIKSANILLNENFVPKVGDFGLVRIGNSSMSTTMAVTGTVYGTSVYMAREAFHGDVSIKLDTFSYGVVLLELLTGLPPYDVSREDKDLVTFMEDCDDILDMLDPKTTWNAKAAIELHKIAKFCLSESKRVRPTISQVLEDLKNCCCS